MAFFYLPRRDANNSNLPYTSHHVIKVISKSAFLKSHGLSFRRTDIDTSFGNLTCILSSTDMCISLFSLFYKIAALKKKFRFFDHNHGPLRNMQIFRLCENDIFLVWKAFSGTAQREGLAGALAPPLFARIKIN